MDAGENQTDVLTYLEDNNFCASFQAGKSGQKRDVFGRKRQISYHPPFPDKLTHLVAPYGLVVKAGAWYLVFARSNGALDVQQVSNLTDVRISEESFDRDSNFVLEIFWGDWNLN